MKIPAAILQTLLPLILPIVANQGDESATEGTPLAVKRLGYQTMVSLGTEGPKWLAEVHSSIPLALWEAAYAEAVEEFEEAGFGDVPGKLDLFVVFA